MNNIPRSSGVYKITCTIDGKRYIGSATNLYQRIYKHKNQLRKNRHENQYLQHAWSKYGEQSFIFEVIELVMPWSLLDREQYWLDELKTYNRDIGFNIALSAYAPQLGRPVSSEHRAKISIANKGREVSIETREKLSLAGKGRIHTVEELSKMSTSQKGKSKTLEHCQRISVSKTGVKMSKEFCEKLSLRMKGKTPPAHVLEASNAACEKTWVLTSPDNEEIIIKNLTRFCREHGLDQGHMSRIAQGKLKTHKGWRCRYA